MRHRGGTPNHGAAMSFEEIAQVLGITRGGAWMAYKSAIRKLKKQNKRHQLEQLVALARSKDRPGL